MVVATETRGPSFSSRARNARTTTYSRPAGDAGRTTGNDVDTTYHDRIGDDHGVTGFWPHLREKEGKKEVCDMFEVLSGQRTSKFCGRPVYRWAVYQAAYAKGFKMQPGDVDIQPWHLRNPVFTRAEAEDAIQRLYRFLAPGQQKKLIIWPDFPNEAPPHAQRSAQVSVTVQPSARQVQALDETIRRQKVLIDDLASDIAVTRERHTSTNPEVLVARQQRLRREIDELEREIQQRRRDHETYRTEGNRLLDERRKAQDTYQRYLADYKRLTGREWTG